MKNNIKNQKATGRFYRLLLKNISHLKDPLWKKINISNVTITNNGQKCVIFYTLFGEKKITVVQKFLSKNEGLIKKIMSKDWSSRFFPQLTFVYDKNLMNAEKIQIILEQIQKNE